MNDSSAAPISTQRKRPKLSRISVFHFFRLSYRSVLFLLTVVAYIRARIAGSTLSLSAIERNPLLWVIWVLFMVEMVFRFFPSNLESPGCQKQFTKNYRPTGRTDIRIHDNNAVVIVALVWIFFNALIGAAYMLEWIDEGILLLVCLAYSVCDMICILFFCPFQTWFLKNKCCSSCRIYNWDYAMMFTPLFFIPNVYSWTLLAASALLMIRWEVTVWRYPERFSENTNQYLACSNCTEKLCVHKKQLLEFRKELVLYSEKQIRRILQKTEEELEKIRPGESGKRKIK